MQKLSDVLERRRGATGFDVDGGGGDRLPLWIRPPKSGAEHYTGFTRAKLYELARDRKIRSVSIREPGASKGVRLFHLGSILKFVEQCEEAAGFVEPEPEPASGKGGVQ